MIVAGIGSRKGVSEVDVLAAIETACAAQGVGPGELGALATTSHKAAEPAIVSVAVQLGLRLLIVDDARAAEMQTATLSAASLAATGTGSVSEAAALAGAGAEARLLGARVAVGGATCALATGKPSTGSNGS